MARFIRLIRKSLSKGLLFVLLSASIHLLAISLLTIKSSGFPPRQTDIQVVWMQEKTPPAIEPSLDKLQKTSRQSRSAGKDLQLKPTLQSNQTFESELSKSLPDSKKDTDTRLNPAVWGSQMSFEAQLQSAQAVEEVAKKIEGFLSYPEVLRKVRFSGQIKIAVELDGTGRLIRLRNLTPSADKLASGSTLGMVKRALEQPWRNTPLASSQQIRLEFNFKVVHPEDTADQKKTVVVGNYISYERVARLRSEYDVSRNSESDNLFKSLFGADERVPNREQWDPAAKLQMASHVCETRGAVGACEIAAELSSQMDDRQGALKFLNHACAIGSLKSCEKLKNEP